MKKRENNMKPSLNWVLCVLFYVKQARTSVLSSLLTSCCYLKCIITCKFLLTGTFSFSFKISTMHATW